MKNLKLTLKAWPVIATATIGLCFLTQTVAGWFGIELPDQANIELVKRYAGWNMVFASLCFQILLIVPALEEMYFRYFAFYRPQKPKCKSGAVVALIPTLVILLGGVCIQSGVFGPRPIKLICSALSPHPWLYFWTALTVFAAIECAIRVCLCRMIAKTSVYSIMAFSSALFSAAHYIAQPFPDSAFVALFFFGLAQCWLYRKTGCVWYPILNHALFNLTNLVLLFVIPA